MDTKDMRGVTFVSSTEEELIRGLNGIPGYEIVNHGRSRGWPLALRRGNTEISIRHEPGSNVAHTSSITPQDQEEGQPALQDDEASRLLAAAADVSGIQVSLNLSENDIADLRARD